MGEGNDKLDIEAIIFVTNQHWSH